MMSTPQDVDMVAAANEAADGSSKVARVSLALRDALRAAGAAAYLRPLVTSHAAAGDLHGALALVRDAKEAQLAQPAEGDAGAGGAACPHMCIADPAPCCAPGQCPPMPVRLGEVCMEGINACQCQAKWSRFAWGALMGGVGCGGSDAPSSDAANGLPNGHGAELAGQGALGEMRQRVARPPPTAEDALKHLLLTVDVERLYRQARKGRPHPAAWQQH